MIGVLRKEPNSYWTVAARKSTALETATSSTRRCWANVNPESEFAHTEIFGPVLSMMHAADIDEAIEMVNNRGFGNQACLFTSSGAAARAFRYGVRSGQRRHQLGRGRARWLFIPFSGWGDSFFGDLHAQGRHGVEFYTETKVVVERWPKAWRSDVLNAVKREVDLTEIGIRKILSE